MIDAARRLSHLWRPLHLGRPSNRLAVLAAAVVTVAAGLLTAELADVGIGAGIVAGLRYGIGAFLAWAIGREIDPDRSATARAALLVYLVAAWLGPPDLGAAVAVLLTLRVVVRTTGLAPTVLDLVVLVGLAALAATSASGFVASLGLAWAVHVDRRLSEPADDRPSEVAAAVAGALAVVVTIVSGSFLTAWEFPAWYELLLLLATAGAAVALRTATVTSLGDRTSRPLDIDRLVHARRVTLVVLAAAVLWAGSSAVAALTPAMAAVVAAGIVASGGGERLAGLVAR